MGGATRHAGGAREREGAVLRFARGYPYVLSSHVCSRASTDGRSLLTSEVSSKNNIIFKVFVCTYVITIYGI